MLVPKQLGAILAFRLKRCAKEERTNPSSMLKVRVQQWMKVQLSPRAEATINKGIDDGFDAIEQPNTFVVPTSDSMP